ncbi:hypothetical protein RsoM2USA_143 [Ralstonia phage RsoM2USA]|nr:hypothetical protein RsoM2USA_143 [Ralstonia phage RsoM2USA]
MSTSTFEKIKEALFYDSTQIPDELENLAFEFLNLNGAVKFKVYGFMISTEKEFNLVNEHFDLLYCLTGSDDLYSHIQDACCPVMKHDWYEGSAFCAVFTDTVKSNAS